MMCTETRLVVIITIIACTLMTPALCEDCNMTDFECEYTIEVDHRLTMMREGDLVYPKDGNVYKYDVLNTSTAEPVHVEEVITGDGWDKPRLIGTVNGKMPGPPIIVYEGQMVIVNVKNNLLNEGLTMHWHGLPMKGTTWMDGVPFVSQCPILPGQTFTYKFKAEPKGTFWYHSHVGTQRSIGLFGALIIREKKPLEMEEHILTIKDYNHDWASEMSYMKDIHGMYFGRTPASPSLSLDGTEFDMFHFHSGLINGRGRFHDPETGTHNGAPLEIFHVKQGASYRFRVISAASMLPFRISVDDHPLLLVASDGHDLEPVMAESFVINPGERYDFVLVANQSVSNYWIRGKTLEVDRNHRTEAILRYEGATISEPTTTKKSCSNADRCLVVNCPYSYFPPSEFTDCWTFDNLKGADWNNPPPQYEAGNFQEHFLNFGIPGEYPASINGIVFQNPTVAAVVQPSEWHFPCEEPECGEEKVCTCTHSIDITHGNTVQIVLVNMGLGKGLSHPVHLHGHSFYVMKMGYGVYNRTTARILGDNLDINCRGNIDREQSYCNNATWSNSSWLNGNVPGLELDRPPLKDTLVLPSSSYAVIRFLADNPGLWDFHCHLEIHNNEGMRLLLNESFLDVPKPPKSFPECRNFRYEDGEPLTGHPEKLSFTPVKDTTGFVITIVVLAVLTVVFFLAWINEKRKSSACCGDKEKTEGHAEYAAVSK